VSDGIAMGAIQVPGDGRPIVLMADRQSTGGYPKIATVIGPDLGRLAQARPGTSFSFEAVSIAQAVAARREEAAMLARRIVAEPLLRTHFPSEFLLGLNLIDGVVGLDPPA
jgi:allophanate hydrolase subunit 2